MIAELALTVLLSTTASAGKESARGGITYFGKDVIYVDKGRADGLTTGATLKAYRGKRSTGTCVVEEVSDHHAICRGQISGRSRGVRFDPGPVEALPPPPDPLTGIDDASRQNGQAALGGASFQKVAARPSARRRPLRLPIEIFANAQTWSMGPLLNKTYHRDRMGIAVRGLPLYVDGLVANLRFDLGGQGWSPPEVRFRPNEPLRPELWEAALSYRPSFGWLALTVGRFAPLYAPGARVLDGVQAGFRWPGDLFEVGAYAGTVPDAGRLIPRYDHFAGGGYWNVATSIGPVYVRHAGRLGAVADLGLDARGEAEALVDVSWSRYLRAGGGIRGAIEVKSPLLPWVDLAYLDVQSSPLDGMSFGASYRYNAPTPEIDLGAPTGLPPPAYGYHHAMASARYAPWSFFGGNARVGGSWDPITGDLRGWVAPEVEVPSLLGGLLGFTAGYQGELGASPAHYVTSSARVAWNRRVEWSARAFGLVQPELGSPLTTFGGTSELVGRPLPWLSLLGRVRGHSTLPALSGHNRPSPTGLAADLELRAAF